MEEAFDEYLQTLDSLRARSRWAEVETFATSSPASAQAHSLASQTAIVEAKLETTLPQGAPEITTADPGIRKTAKGLLAKLEGLRPGPGAAGGGAPAGLAGGASAPSALSVYIWAVAVAHLHVLTGHYKTAVQEISAAPAPAGAADFDYLRAIVVKSRVLLAAAMAELGDPERAIQTIHSVTISDHTLRHVPEAARWAERLYNREVQLTRRGTADREAALRSYARVVELSGLHGSSEWASELAAVTGAAGGYGGVAAATGDSRNGAPISTGGAGPGLAAAEGPAAMAAEFGGHAPGVAGAGAPGSANPQNGGGEFFDGDDASVRRYAPEDTSAASAMSGSGDSGVSDPRGAGLSRGKSLSSRLQNIVGGGANRQSTATSGALSAGNGAAGGIAASTGAAAARGGSMTALQHQLKILKSMESDAEARVEGWRRTTALQKPIGAVTSQSDLERTRLIFTYIVDSIEKTFNSVVLMRLLTEILIALGKIEEALAAFNVYVTYQKLQLARHRTGASGAAPDSGRGVASIFLLVLHTLIVSEQLQHGTYTDVDKVTELAANLEAILPGEEDPEAVGMAHGVLAQAAMFESARIVGNDYYQRCIARTGKHFELAFKTWAGDASTFYAYGHYLVHVRGPVEAFPVIKDAAAKSPDDLPLWHLLILLLTAQDSYEYAQQVTEGVLEQYRDAASVVELSSHYKRVLLEIKKTHIAILEARWGIGEALDALPGAVQLSGFLYPQLSDHARTTVQKMSGHAEAHRSRRQKRAEAAANGSVAAQGSSRGFLGLRSRGARNSQHRRGAASVSSSDTDGPGGISEKTAALSLGAQDLSESVRQQLVALWVWVAQLYNRAELKDEADQALKEAISVGGLTASVLAASSFIQAEENPAKAWRQATSALASDPINLSAALARASLLERLGRLSGNEIDTTRESALFSEAKLEAAAYRDTVNLLEDLVTRSPGRYTAEAWYYMGALHEALGDVEAAKAAYWQSVALEEKTGVRGYL